jgi:hypothetical protein
MSKQELEITLAQLTSARVQADEARQIRVAAEERFRKANADLYSLEEGMAEAVKLIETEARRLAIDFYDNIDDSSKQVAPGCSIAISLRDNFTYDAATALAWAKSHDMCLALDAKAFEGLCKTESMRPVFVEAEESSTTTVRLAADLAKHYPQAAASPQAAAERVA